MKKSIITPKKYITKKGWFCYCSREDGSKAFKISQPFEKLPKEVQSAYFEKCGEIVFNHYSLFL